MFNPNKSYYRDNSLKSTGKLGKIGVVRYHDTYRTMWKTRAQSKRIHATIALSRKVLKVK